jgi:cytochrome b pre-mRNA-processing protein 3
MGVGDLSVGKKMRKLGEALFGRAKSYEAAFNALPATDLLEALLVRTIYAEIDASSARRLVDYVLGQRDHLAAQDLDRLLAGELDWRPA